MYYVGPTLFWSPRFGKHHSFILNSQFSIGYYHYKNNAVLKYGYHITGSTLGGTWDLGVEYLFSKHIAACISASATIGRMRDFRVKEDVLDNLKLVSVDFSNSLNVSRIDFGIGIKGYF